MIDSATSPRVIGQPLDRVDGRLKVTGKAKYATEVLPPKCLQSFAVLSSISKGKITRIDAAKAQKSEGVRAVITHENAPKLAEPKPDQQARGGMRSEERLPLKDAEIHYGGQYVALVVADTFEQARYAASLIKIDYASEEPILTLAAAQAESKKKKPSKNNGEPVQGKKGDVAKAFEDASFYQFEATYETPIETHNPIELSGTVAVWNASDRLTVYDATQYVKGVQDVLSLAFKIPRENVRVISPFVGGAFGCKGSVWPHVILAAMAARVAGAPVKLTVSRMAMFSCTGHRTPTKQTIKFAARRDGTLQAIHHFSETFTSGVGNYTESCGTRSTGVIYQTPALLIEELVYVTNQPSSTFMRAPGECPGSYAMESAIDELSYALKVDPLKIRELNYSHAHQLSEKPWSTKHLMEAYRLGAEKFGWEKRNPTPGSMMDGSRLVGWGVATATYPAHKRSADAKVRLKVDGTAVVQSATHDLGTGAYTAFTQISAEALGLPVESVTFELGDSNLPYGPVAGGSNSTATVGSAIYLAAKALHGKLAAMAIADAASPLQGSPAEDIILAEVGILGRKSDPSKKDAFVEIIKRSGKEYVEAEGRLEQEDPKKAPQAFQSFGVHFVEVKLNPLLPRVEVTRVVTVIDGGRIINAKTAHSQIIGAVVMGIGMALTEETILDEQNGLSVTRNLADYHVPVNADIKNLEAYFVGEPDFAFNPTGARGIGEIGNTGIAAAVANAVYHATGKRIRELPITPDKLI